jgi:outer membrane protein assembly factor BamB
MPDSAPPAQTARRPRRRPGWWVVVLLAIPIGLIAWLRTDDRTGDAGMTNAYTVMLAIPAVAIALLWFMLCPGFRRRTRLLTLAGVAAAVGLFVGLFRVDAYTGSLLPTFAPRWRKPAGLPADLPVPVAPGRVVDLATATDRDFPAFLGANRDLHVPGIELARDWSAHPPRRLWRKPIGAGWSAFAVVNGVAVTQEEREGRQLVTAYDVETGSLLWAHDWSGAYAHSLGGPGPRSTPAIDEGRVYAAGPWGRFVCLEGADGSVAWELDLLEAYTIPLADERATIAYGRSGSPLVHGNHVILPVGGPTGSARANLVAFDKRTGDEVWRGSDHQISYSSPIVATLCGVEQILIVNESTVTGHDPETGRLLWEHAWPGRTQADPNVSQAVPLDDASVLVSKGYGLGSARIDLTRADDGTFAAERRWHHRRSLRTKFTNALVRDGHAYGLSDGILECIELEGGARKWKAGRYGHGQILGVGSLLIVLTEDGELVLVEPRPDEANHVLGRADAIDGLTWNNLALFGDVLLVRNGIEAAAYRLAVAGGTTGAAD